MRFFKLNETEVKPVSSVKAPDKKTKGFSSFFAKIVCVLAAVIVWFYVSGEQSITYEKEFQGVEIKYNMGTLGEKGYSIISGKNTTVNVKVAGTRRDVNNIKAEDIVASVDLSAINTAGEYPVEIDVTAPGNTTVKNVYPYELKLYIDTPTKKAFKVDINAHNVATSDPTIKIRRYILSVDQVWVTGPEEEVNKIAGARVDVDFSGERIFDSVSRTGVTINLYDSDGKIYTSPYLEMDETYTNVDVIVNKYVTVPIKAKYSGNFTAKDAGYSEVIEPSEVSIKGTPETVSGITYIETAEIDADEISAERFEKEVTLSFPAGVEADGIAPKSVSVNLERTNGRRAVTTANIVLINKSDKLEYTVDEESVKVIFSGNLSDIENLNEKNVYMIADLSGITREGVYEDVKLRPNLFGMDVLESGRVRVENVYTCTISAKLKKDAAAGQENTSANVTGDKN